MEDELFLDEDAAPSHPAPAVVPWKILIVDDEREIHAVTKLVLSDFHFENRPLQFLSAYSGIEGKEVLKANPDIALMLLDVVMETDHAGLEVARWTRDELNNTFIRIVLRTGQPGQAPEQRVTTEYDINDYKEKTELTTQKLTATVRVALRGYRDIMLIERARQGLERVIESSAFIFSRQRTAEFASAVLSQLGNLVGMERGALYLRVPPEQKPEGDLLPEHFEISAATGEFERFLQDDHDASHILPQTMISSLHQAYQAKHHLFRDDHYVLHFVDSQHGESLLYVGDAWNLSDMDFQLVELFCTNVSIAYENLHLNQELFDSQLEMICLLAGAVETRSKETANHVKRVGLIAEALALAAGADGKTAESLRFAAPLHDLGKIGIADAVLNKPGRHDDEERRVMQTHAELGGNMLAESKRPLLRLAAEIARNHHENWDGSGYPKGLKGEEIPFGARIVSLADVFDALGSHRCYKDPWPETQIRGFLIEQRAVKFDPNLVDIALAHWNALMAFREVYPD